MRHDKNLVQESTIVVRVILVGSITEWIKYTITSVLYYFYLVLIFSLNIFLLGGHKSVSKNVHNRMCGMNNKSTFFKYELKIWNPIIALTDKFVLHTKCSTIRYFISPIVCLISSLVIYVSFLPVLLMHYMVS